MKRTLSLDFTAERDATGRMVDAWFARQVALRWPLATLHAVKARLAQQVVAGGDLNAAIGSEAAARQVKPLALCAEILTRAAEADDAAMALEDQRMAVKRAIAAATTGQQLAAIRSRFVATEAL